MNAGLTVVARTDAAHPDADRETILIVDDDATNRLVLRGLLKQAGYHVFEARDGAEAVESYFQYQPQAVLMDVMMPVMDGYEATRVIKETAGSSYVPIIFVTALMDERSLARCVDIGGVDFITKPYNKTILALRLEAVLRMRRLYAQLQAHAQTIKQHNEYMQQEQETAERIFTNMVHRGHLQDACFNYRVSPAAIFNGDLLLAMRMDEDSYRVLIGDFTGHGLPAAVGAIPVAETFYAMTAKRKPLRELAREINCKLKSILPPEIFLSMCVMNVSHTQLEIWNAGMPDVLITSENSPSMQRVASQHLPAGILPDAQFSAQTLRIELSAGARIYAYSDGVTEAMNATHDLFGEARLLQCLCQESVADYVECTWRAVAEFVQTPREHDDMSMIEIIPARI